MSVNSTRAVSRRRVLQAIGASSVAVGLAGCSGDDDDDDLGDVDESELGERVPTITIEYLPDFGSWEDIVPILEENIEEALNHDVKLVPLGISEFLDHVYNDARSFHYSTWGLAPSPTQLDPSDYKRMFMIDWAGPNGNPNRANYVNCEFSNRIWKILNEVGDLKQRKELFHEALEIWSDDRVTIPIVPRDEFVAIWGNEMDVGGEGVMGGNILNLEFFLETTHAEEDQFIYTTQTDFFETINHLTITGENNHGFFSLVYDKLLYYDKDLELQEGLAADWTSTDDATEFEFEIKEATFHNGEPVTAEDVKFTYEYIEESTAPLATDQDYASIEAVDDRTVRFTFDNSRPAFPTVHLPLWGVMPQSVWEEVDSIEEFNPDADDIIGSGPFELVSYSPGERITVVPYEDHHTWSPEAEITFLWQADKSTRMRAFRNGEAHVAADLAGRDFETLRNDVDEVLESNYNGFGNWMLQPSYVQAPVRYNAFQEAVGASIDRQRISAVVFDGLSEPVLHCSTFNSGHPWWPEGDGNIYKFTDDPEGDVEEARQALTDAGWGWDGDDNLRYPEGTDTTPLYPEGEFPDPDDFACLDENGDFVPLD